MIDASRFFHRFLSVQKLSFVFSSEEVFYRQSSTQLIDGLSSHILLLPLPPRPPLSIFYSLLLYVLSTKGGQMVCTKDR